MKTSPKERLEDLKKNLPPNEPPQDDGPLPPNEPPQEPGPGSEAEMEFTPEEIAGMVLSGTNSIRQKHGLAAMTEKDPLSIILRFGIIGTCKKYDIKSLGMGNYPEFLTLVAGGLIVYDTVNEIKAKRQREEEEKKRRPAPEPEAQA